MQIFRNTFMKRWNSGPRPHWYALRTERTECHFGIFCCVQAGLHDSDSLQLLKQYGHSGKPLYVTKLVQDITVVAADTNRSNTLLVYTKALFQTLVVYLKKVGIHRKLYSHQK